MESIRVIDRASGKEIIESVPSERMLRFLYTKPLGRLSLNLLFKRKFFSALAGWYMNTGLSKSRIRSFLSEFDISLEEYEVPEKGFKTFNQFFYRKIKTGSRPIGKGLVSPADGRIFAFQDIQDHKKFFVKGKEFTVTSFLNNKKLAEQYIGGSMVIVRLAPVDYHRFHFPESGSISASSEIKGAYYSVSPLALRNSLDIFCQNKREYSVLESESYGSIIISEVGATIVGSIIQTYDPQTTIQKGEEKGYFAMGGSTLVLLFEAGKVRFDQDLIQNTNNGLETLVKMGEQIAS